VSLAACSRCVIACRRPGGVIGTDSGQESGTARGLSEACADSEQSLCPSVGRTSAILPSGHSVMPDVWSAQKSVSPG
jgi:hypothetical protein